MLCLFKRNVMTNKWREIKSIRKRTRTKEKCRGELENIEYNFGKIVTEIRCVLYFFYAENKYALYLKVTDHLLFVPLS